MKDPYLYPKIRYPVDVQPHKVNGQDILLFRCPLGISTEPLALIAGVTPIISRFNGESSIDDLLNQFQQYGVDRSLLTELVQLIDKHLFLESPNFYQAQKDALESFKSSAVRRAALAGSTYPSNPEFLKNEIEGYLKLATPKSKLPSSPMLGLSAPHIDYRRGHRCYAEAYRQLPEQKHDLYILIGTSHQYSPRLFHLTAKDFETPLGTLSCDRELVHDLAAKHGMERSFADELLHRQEHSLELQTPFLQYLGRSTKIVPILVGSFHQMISRGIRPSAHDEYESFVNSLTELLAERRRQGARVCVVAGVDMAHVGKHFGDAEALTPERMAGIESRDKLYIDTILKQDKDAMFQHIAEDEDVRRICGFPTMYTVLDLFDRLEIRYEARLFDYRQAIDYQTDCAVTFAGIGMYSAPQ